MRNFEDDLRAGFLSLMPLPDKVVARTQELSRQTTARLGTRTGDVLHVAAALELGMDCLFSLDKQQRTLAQAVGLKLN